MRIEDVRQLFGDLWLAQGKIANVRWRLESPGGLLINASCAMIPTGLAVCLVIEPEGQVDARLPEGWKLYVAQNPALDLHGTASLGPPEMIRIGPRPAFHFTHRFVPEKDWPMLEAIRSRARAFLNDEVCWFPEDWTP